MYKSRQTCGGQRITSESVFSFHHISSKARTQIVTFGDKVVSTFYFETRTLVEIWGLLTRLGWLSSENQVICLSLPLQLLGSLACTTMPGISKWVMGFKLWDSWFTNQPSPLPLPFPCFSGTDFETECRNIAQAALELKKSLWLEHLLL